MSDEKLDSIEKRQIRMENDIRAINELLNLFITRGAEQADARFQCNEQKFGGLASGFVANPAGA